jgi:DNA-binding HxlR family transcriptional regulator
VLVQEEQPLSAADFHNNDSKILSVLNEAGSNYSFKGLMRKLNLHQQSLSRALHRLEEMGLVEKSPVGYRLIKGTESAISRIDLQRQKGREYMQLLQTYIPLNLRASEIVRQLLGKWFKNLRWLGMIESGTGYTLQWSSDDGSFQINLRMISDYIVIETNASTEKEKVDAMVGSYAIYEQITKAMQSKLGTFSVDHRVSYS